MAKEQMPVEKAPKIPQPEAMVMPEIDQPFVRPQQIIEPQDKPIDKEWADAMQRLQEHVTIRFFPTQSFSQHPTRLLECNVNGRGPLILEKGKMVRHAGFPVGVPVTTQRMHAEVMARVREMTVRTEVRGENSSRPENFLHRTVTHTAQFSIVEDKSPIAAEWAARMLSMA